MSSPGQREMVFCHSCSDEWYREEHGLACPRCQSEFVEVIEPGNDPRDTHDDDDHDEEEEWGSAGPGAVPDIFGIGRNSPPFSAFGPSNPANRGNSGFTYRTIRSPGGGLTFTSASYSSYGTANRGGPDPHADVMNNFGTLLQNIMGNAARSPGAPAGFGYPPGGRLHPRDANHAQQPPQLVDDLPNIMTQFFPVQDGQRSPGSPGIHDAAAANPLLGMMRMMLTGHPAMAGSRDAAYSQEEFDRILSNLMEQTQGGGGPPPASQSAVSEIPKKPVTTEMLGENGKAECTICMDEVKLGEEVSEMWCNHWFHTHCIEAWLNEHDSCPHCRKTLQEGKEEARRQGRRPSNRERRSSHRMSSHRGSRSSENNDNTSSSADSPNGGGGGGGLRDRISGGLRGMFGGGRSN